MTPANIKATDIKIQTADPCAKNKAFTACPVYIPESISCCISEKQNEIRQNKQITRKTL